MNKGPGNYLNVKQLGISNPRPWLSFKAFLYPCFQVQEASWDRKHKRDQTDF